MEAVPARVVPPPLAPWAAQTDAAVALGLRAGPTAEIATEQPQRVPDSFQIPVLKRPRPATVLR